MSAGYKLISRKTCAAPTGAHQVKWHFTIDGKHYLASHISFALDTGQPECMVFKANPNGSVKNWLDLAVSYCSDPDEGFAECLHDMMLGKEDDAQD